ncbi:helix-turn-helix transcriptional regulator [Saccharothrix xinjiangensis]|uniref:Helix-turn-helix domain-containing protein n=1 Tax=Saccharothrix xinjiangensis TaxID=204798 RepID=A0ABV9XQZ4_9PSEU
MEHRTSNALSRELGDALRRARRDAQLKTATLLAELGWSPGKLSKLETGTRGTSTDDIARLVGHIRAEPDIYEHIMALAHEPPSGYYTRPHDVAMPDSLRMLIMHEQMAKSIRSYETIVVPGLLQTADYARALMGEGPEVDQAVVDRMIRQGVLDKPLAPRCRFYIYEAVLHRVIGGPQVMYEQMLQLLFRGGVYLIPFTATLPRSLNSPFTYMTYADHFPITYVECGAASLFLDTFEATRAYQQSCNDLARVALSEEQSRSVFAKWADRFDRLREAAGATKDEVA